MTDAAGKEGSSSVNLFAEAPRDLGFSLSLFLSFPLSPHAQTGAVFLSQRTYSSWPASLGVHTHKAD